MSDAMFWNPKTETLDREQLRALQLAKLQRLVGWAAARSPFYQRTFREAGFTPELLKAWDDIQRIPFLTRDAWMASQDAVPPFGELPVASHVAATRLHTTSGTSGRTPLRALDTRRDWKWSSEMWAYALWGMGVRRHDIGYLAFGYGSFIGFWGLHNALEKIGALTIPGGAQSTEARVKQIIEFGVTTVASTPTYAVRLAQAATELGYDLAASPVHTIVLSGEPIVPEMKALLEEAWGAKAYDTAGMTEISTIFMFEPENQPGGCHIIEEHFIEEVIDPDTGLELPYGAAGERVSTSFGRGIIPLIRYRTADRVVKLPAASAGNGRTWDLYEGGLQGRVDDMKLVRGTNVYPRAVESIVRSHEGIEEFQIRITRQGIRDEITLVVEPTPALSTDAWTQLEASLVTGLADSHEGLRFIIERAPENALPRFELKARRLQDLRNA